MIVIYHKNNNVIAIKSEKQNISFSHKKISQSLFEIAEKYPDNFLIWTHVDYATRLNFSVLEDIFHHKKIMASYNPEKNSYLSEAIGYVDESVFLNINKNVTYPSWQMSSWVGGVHASVLLACKDKIHFSGEFDYFLHSFSKLAMPKGLFCYSEPKLLKDVVAGVKKQKDNYYILFRFIKQHYRTRWVFLLFLNLILYQKKVLFLPLIFSLFYLRREQKDILLDNIEINSAKKTIESATIDVIIPTIGRKQHLYDVLKDLSLQAHLPVSVIIVEQNPIAASASELDYLSTESWPFIIKHIFTHKAGACNARNLALAEVKSEWVFMADDDIRINDSFLSEAFEAIKILGASAITLGCYEKEYPIIKKQTHRIQWNSFGSGCSIVKTKCLENVKYNEKFEFGYGEDTDFGMMLRSDGTDILFLPEPEILHLKAPIGGFRTQLPLAWNADKIQPKPSPSVMLFKLLHLNQKQILGYKTILFFKFYLVQQIKNPIKYYTTFQKQWQKSLYWANYLNNKE
jgi:glycosyltransferase involved in cell wall biosynthesis